jgi:hypothetical protein
VRIERDNDVVVFVTLLLLSTTIDDDGGVILLLLWRRLQIILIYHKCCMSLFHKRESCYDLQDSSCSKWRPSGLFCLGRRRGL